ncbi:MAG: dihydrofolate reductase family protein [Solirubrobacterales bacterium]
MGRIVVTEFVSMDGVMQAPGGEEFKYEGWTFDFDRGEDGGRFKAEEIFNAEAQLIGRVTYESFADAWPTYEQEWEGEMKEFAHRFNSMPKYVVSSTLTDPEWTNCTVIDGSGDVPAQVASLKDEIDGNILLAGSRRLAQELLEQDLVDELRLMVFPVILGTGDRLFGEFTDKSTWKLAESNPVGKDGVLTLVYERV